MSRGLSALAAGGALALSAAVSLPAAAAPPRNAPGWAFGSPGGEAALGAASVLSLATYFLPQRYSDEWDPLAAVAYEPVWDSLSDLSGSAIGSTMQIANGYFFEAAYLNQPGQDEPFLRALRVPLIDIEAAVLTTGLVLGIKRISGRCRPRAFTNGRCLQTRSAHEGFPSGHTGPIAAIAGVHLALAARSDGPAGYRYAPFVIAEIGAVGTAILRVVSGAHDWSDVGVGWGLGHLVGVLVSLAHPMESVGAAPSGTGGAALRSTPAAPALRWSGRF